MAVEVGADPVQDLTRETVILPLLGVKLQHTLVHQVLAVLQSGKNGGCGGQEEDLEAGIAEGVCVGVSCVWVDSP